MIRSFYNTTAILEVYSVVSNSYGQEVKTWRPSTFLIGNRQLRTGSNSIVNNSQNIRLSERFYTSDIVVTDNYRLLFSTKSYIYQGTATGSSMFLSTNIGALYFCSNSFTTYSAGDYARYGSTGYAIENFKYYKVVSYYNLLNIHCQIDLEEDIKERT